MCLNTTDFLSYFLFAIFVRIPLCSVQIPQTWICRSRVFSFCPLVTNFDIFVPTVLALACCHGGVAVLDGNAPIVVTEFFYYNLDSVCT